MEHATMRFDITGEFITKTAREWLYIEGKEMEKVIELLMSCMAGTDTPEATIRRYAEDILIGRAELKGNTADGTYHLEKYEPEEQPKMPDNMNIWKVLESNIKERKRLQEELDEMTERYAVAMEHLSESEQQDVLRELGEEVEEDQTTSLLDSFMKRWKDEEEHTTEDYGWLEPNGTFHAVEWGEHQDWAKEYLREHEPEAADDEVDMQMKCNVGMIGAGDRLVEKGWVLLHNPSQGIAFPTKNPVKDYTKAQREFLYDYYIERNCQKEANTIWNEIDNAGIAYQEEVV